MRKGTEIVLVVLAVAGFVAPCFADPASVQVNASADVLVRSMDPDHNYGGAALAVSGSESVNANGDQMGLIDSFIRFDMSGAVSSFDAVFGTGQWRVAKAQMSLVEQGAPNNPIYNRGVGLFETRWIAADEWIEGTGTPKQLTTDGITYADEASLLNPSVDTPIGTFANSGADGTLTFDLTLADAFAANIKAGGLLTLFLTAASDSIGFQFNSIDNTAPMLEITADTLTWPIPGDANMSCKVDILDLIFIRNRLNQDVTSGDNWQADVNGDGRINILDLIYTRNRLNATCGQ